MTDIQPTQSRDLGLPDWTSTDDLLNIHCPLCEYNLRGLSEPRCPECGYQFVWLDLLDPARREHPYLFETYSGSLFASYWRTAYNGLRPVKFWNTLRAHLRVAPLRLTLYALVTTFICGVGIGSNYAIETFYSYRQFIAAKTWVSGSPGFFLAPFNLPPLDQTAFIAMILIGWPLLTFLSLMVFQISMRRVKVKSFHVLRCVVYGWDAIVWVTMIAIFVNAVLAIDIYLHRPSPFISMGPAGGELRMEILASAWAAATIFFAYRLVVAYRSYLRFRHALATIFMSQVIVVLLTVIVCIHWKDWLNLPLLHRMLRL